MTRSLTLLPLIALLGACGSADGELTAGNWKNTMTMTKFDIPGAPPQVAQQAQAVVGQPQSTEACMTPEQAKAGVRDFSSELQDGDCTMDDFTQGNGEMSGTMVCTGGPMGATTLAMTGTYTAEKVDMTLAGELNDTSLPGGKATIEMALTSERIGECAS